LIGGFFYKVPVLPIYAQDSFFDLSPWGRVGLVCISIVLFLLVLWITAKILGNKTFLLRIAGSLTVFWLFVWLSPQVYYMYYMTIFDDLPLQWVIWPIESPLVALEYLFFMGPQNLSAHSQGLLGWSLILIPFLRKKLSLL